MVDSIAGPTIDSSISRMVRHTKMKKRNYTQSAHKRGGQQLDERDGIENGNFPPSDSSLPMKKYCARLFFNSNSYSYLVHTRFRIHKTVDKMQIDVLYYELFVGGNAITRKANTIPKS